MNRTPFEKIELLCEELYDLQRENADKYLYDTQTKLFHEYTVRYVYKWLEESYSSSFKKYSRSDISHLVSSLLNYAENKKNAKSNREYWKNILDAMANKNHLMKVPGKSASDGSKHFAHSYRDNGQFGSFPVHDDYSEESDL